MSTLPPFQPSTPMAFRPLGNARGLQLAAQSPPALLRPMYESPSPQAGFPSPATDYVEDPLDLNALMVTNPPATFYVRSRGDSMIDAGIFDGDILVVDRSVEATPGQIVVAVFDGSILVKRLRRLAGRMALCSENAAAGARYQPMYFDQAQDASVWGVVTGSVRRF